MNSNEDIKNKLAAIPDPQVAFNYLGQFSQFENDRRFQVAEWQSDYERDPLGRRPHQIFVSGKIAREKLQVHFSYSENLYKVETIDKVAQYFLSNLREIIAYAKNAKENQIMSNHLTGDMISEDDLEDVLSELDIE